MFDPGAARFALALATFSMHLRCSDTVPQHSHVKQTQTRNRELLAQTLQQEVIERLTVNERLHVTAIRLELLADGGLLRFELSRRRNGKHRVVQETFEPAERIFELARIQLRTRRH